MLREFFTFELKSYRRKPLVYILFTLSFFAHFVLIPMACFGSVMFVVGKAYYLRLAS